MGDKIAHCIVYGVLGALCYRGVALATNLRGAVAVAATVLVALVYGVSDEIHQMFVPQRSSDVFDVVADVIGGALGAVVAFVYLRRRGRP